MISRAFLTFTEMLPTLSKHGMKAVICAAAKIEGPRTMSQEMTLAQKFAWSALELLCSWKLPKRNCLKCLLGTHVFLIKLMFIHNQGVRRRRAHAKVVLGPLLGLSVRGPRVPPGPRSYDSSLSIPQDTLLDRRTVDIIENAVIHRRLACNLGPHR